MIFAPESIDSAQAGRKTNTRRPRQPGETYDSDEHGNIIRVHTTKGRIKWEVGRTYAMNPPPPKGSKARMGKQVGRFMLKGIRCERVCDITDEDAIAEGVLQGAGVWFISFKGTTFQGPTPREAFLAGWKKFYRSDLTELVWVLEFEVVKS